MRKHSAEYLHTGQLVGTHDVKIALGMKVNTGKYLELSISDELEGHHCGTFLHQ